MRGRGGRVIVLCDLRVELDRDNSMAEHKAAHFKLVLKLVSIPED
jgi:hypothetical protein